MTKGKSGPKRVSKTEKAKAPEEPKLEMCQDCGDAPAGFEDPRDPPLDEGECLCRDCYACALESRITELEEEAAQLQKELDVL